MPFTFQPLTHADLPLLHAWLQRPHVAEVWDGPTTLEATIAEYSDDIAHPAIWQYLAHLDGEPVGYIQAYQPSAFPDWWPEVTDTGARGVDCFLADAGRLNQGLGTAMVQAFVDFLFADPAVTYLQIDPAPDNARAIAAYKKAGFYEVGPITTPDGPALLMWCDRPA